MQYDWNPYVDNVERYYSPNVPAQLQSDLSIHFLVLLVLHVESRYLLLLLSALRVPPQQKPHPVCHQKKHGVEVATNSMVGKWRSHLLQCFVLDGEWNRRR